MDNPTLLEKTEISALENSRTEEEWYGICDEIKSKREGRFAPDLARDIFNRFRAKFKKHLS
ncbi:MAG: hypothetical protein H8D46_02665 [FCB group bacterium]|nr:hypothetical protein [FCB group bacterium]